MSSDGIEPRKRARVTLDGERLSQNLLRRRKELGWSLRELADRSGFSTSAVHALEQGNTRVQLDTFVAVLDALDLLPSDVLVVDDSTPPKERPLVVQRLEEIARLEDPAEVLRRLAVLLDQADVLKAPNQPIAAKMLATTEPAKIGGDAPEAASTDEGFYDEFSKDVLLHLVSMARGSEITPPLSASQIAGSLGDESGKGKRTKMRIQWLLDHGYISLYTKSGGSKGSQYRILERALKIAKDGGANTRD